MKEAEQRQKCSSVGASARLGVGGGVSISSLRKGNAVKTEGRLILDLGSIPKPPLGIGL